MISGSNFIYIYILMFGFNIVVAIFSQSSLSLTFCKEVTMGGGGGLISRIYIIHQSIQVSDEGHLKEEFIFLFFCKNDGSQFGKPC